MMNHKRFKFYTRAVVTLGVNEKMTKDLLFDVLSFLIGCVLGAIVLLPNFIH